MYWKTIPNLYSRMTPNNKTGCTSYEWSIHFLPSGSGFEHVKQFSPSEEEKKVPPHLHLLSPPSPGWHSTVKQPANRSQPRWVHLAGLATRTVMVGSNLGELHLITTPWVNMGTRNMVGLDRLRIWKMICFMFEKRWCSGSSRSLCVLKRSAGSES